GRGASTTRLARFDSDRLDWSFQTATRAKPARPERRHASGASAGSPMWPGTSPLPAAFAFRLSRGGAGAVDGLDEGDGGEGRRRFLCRLLGRLLEGRLELALAEDLVLAPRVLGLALLQDRQERCGNEDRGVRTGRDADHQREREVLQRVTAEQEQRADRQQRDERGRQ